MDDEIDSTCEQCGKGFDHTKTDAIARFDFCCLECEKKYSVLDKRELPDDEFGVTSGLWLGISRDDCD